MRLNWSASQPHIVQPDRSPANPILHASWAHARTRALEALREGRRTIRLVGPPGTGKTMLLRELARSLEAEGFVVEALFHADVPLSQVGDGLHSAERNVVLADEADRLSPDGIRKLLAHATGSLVIAGVGFPDSVEPILPPHTLCLSLAPLEEDEIAPFVAVRTALAGLSPDFFADDAVQRLAKHSEGIPRLLVSLSDAAAWLAEMNAASQVGSEHVDEAAMLRQGAGFQDFGLASVVAEDQSQTRPPPSLTDRLVAVSSRAHEPNSTSTPDHFVQACMDRAATVSSLPSEAPALAPRPTRKRHRGHVLVPIMVAGVLALSAVWLMNTSREREADFVGLMEEASAFRGSARVGDRLTESSSENMTEAAREAVPFLSNDTPAVATTFQAGQVIAEESAVVPWSIAGTRHERYSREPTLHPSGHASASEQPLPTPPAYAEPPSPSVALAGSWGRAAPDALDPAASPTHGEFHVPAGESEVIPAVASLEHPFVAGTHAATAEPQALPFAAAAERPTGPLSASRTGALINPRSAPATAEPIGMPSGLSQPVNRTERRGASRTAQSAGPPAKSALSVRLPLPPQPPARRPAALREATSLPVRLQKGQMASSR